MFRTVTQDLRLDKNYRETVLKRSQYGSIRNLSLTEVPQFTLTLIKGYHLKKDLFCAILSYVKNSYSVPSRSSHLSQPCSAKSWSENFRKLPTKIFFAVINETLREKLVLYWTQYKNSLKYKVGCFWRLSYVYTVD